MTSQTRPPSVRRKILFVDPRIQGALLVRVAMYWVFALLAVTLMLLLWRVTTTPQRMFFMHFDYVWLFQGPALVASFLLLPIVLVDVVKVSNRIVGPLIRLRRGLRALAQGEPVAKLHFRQGDYFQEAADDFNLLVTRLERERQVETPSDEETLCFTTAAAQRGGEAG